MARREAALHAKLGPLIDVVVARRDLVGGRTLELSDLGVRPAGALRATGRAGFAAALAADRPRCRWPPACR